MDRLLCGDVGYGKTEVAMRAAFKAVMEGKQVAFLAPTTILAFQHEDAARALQRFPGLHRHGEPLPLETGAEGNPREPHRRKTRHHRRHTPPAVEDVQFKDLGLLVVDEEQRFGVAHKEVEAAAPKVHVLTMSATPIPRTLNMSLVGIRDMSVIETPPKDRLSIQTNVVKFDQQRDRRAIRQELERGGQVLARPQPSGVHLRHW